jgi:ElaB/YqjD/DUF883 family membrane-anchored ribosome-binding protein
MAVDLDRLVAEMKELRSELGRMSEALVGSVKRQTGDAAAKVRDAAEDTWSGAMDATAGVARSIEDQPLVATAIAFGVGMLLGMLFLGRRR